MSTKVRTTKKRAGSKGADGSDSTDGERRAPKEERTPRAEVQVAPAESVTLRDVLSVQSAGTSSTSAADSEGVNKRLEDMISRAVQQAVKMVMSRNAHEMPDECCDKGDSDEKESELEESETARLSEMQGFRGFLEKISMLNADNWTTWIVQVSQLSEQLKI